MNSAQFQPQAAGQLEIADFVQVRETGKHIVRVQAFVPNRLPPSLDIHSLTGRLFDLLDRVKTRLVELSARVDALPSASTILSAMRTRETQASSKIEDTFASLQEVAVAALPGATPNVNASPSALEVIRNREAIEYGLASPLPISRRLLCEMHAKLIVNPSKRPGQLRDIQVCIGDEHRGAEHARFVPPPAAHVQACIEDWERFHNPNALGVPPRPRLPYFIELALSHYQFETIHPFSDGNGRLGRAVVNIAPVKDGILRHPVCNLSEWVQSNRQEYYDRLLAVSTHGAWEEWIRFFLTALAEQAESDTRRFERLAALYTRYLALLDERGASVRVTRLINHLFQVPVVSIPVAASIMDIAYTAAQRHVKFLIEKGVLAQVGTGARDRLYLSVPILAAIRGDGEDQPSSPNSPE